MEKLLHLSFTEQRMDYIANVLAQRPYAEVAPVMAEIARQLAQQQGEPDGMAQLMQMQKQAQEPKPSIKEKAS